LAPPIRIGISACLLGQEVRFDGGHKRDAFLTDVLGKHVECVPVCPEVEVGMGTPRETLRLVRDNGTTRMVTTLTGVDCTARMNTWSKRRVGELARADLDGYVLKKDSPSCGMERVKIFAGSGSASRHGRGLFASVLLAALPLLPVEEEGRLTDPSLRENFIERVFAYRRLKDLFAGRWSMGSLVEFHTAHKMSLLARSTTAYRELGRLVADGAKRPRAEVRAGYEQLFMKTLALPATVRRHTNVLMHMAGHLKTRLDETSRRELVESIDDYRAGLVPLVVPLTLIRHHARVHDVKYLAGQIYLRPDPLEVLTRKTSTI
jgi:uncharacterized protein YbgA (DUF1722 family)/uncharacterized protein YbbK (DUF523 family)